MGNVIVRIFGVVLLSLGVGIAVLGYLGGVLLGHIIVGIITMIIGVAFIANPYLITKKS